MLTGQDTRNKAAGITDDQPSFQYADCFTHPQPHSVSNDETSVLAHQFKTKKWETTDGHGSEIKEQRVNLGDPACQEWVEHSWVIC